MNMLKKRETQWSILSFDSKSTLHYLGQAIATQICYLYLQANKPKFKHD